jgi:putative DNA primase/helicase
MTDLGNAAKAAELLGSYRWSLSPWSGRLGEPPGWLLDLIAPGLAAAPRRPPTALPVSAHSRNSGRVAAYVASALAGEVGRVQSARPGYRNLALCQASANVGEIVGAGVLDRNLAEAWLTLAAGECGLVRDDGHRAVLATIASGMARGAANPRRLRP